MNDYLMVVLDVSGSFAENGKLSILRALRLSALAFARKFEAEADVFIWRDEVRPFESPADVVPEGIAEPEALIDFISACDEGSKFLIISDGIWSGKDAARIRTALKANNSSLAMVAVGADAVSSSNYCISTVGGIWSALDLGAAIGAVLAA